MANNIQIQVNCEIKTTINPYIPLSELDLLNKLEKSREHVAQGKVQDANKVIRSIRTKHNLLQV